MTMRTRIFCFFALCSSSLLCKYGEVLLNLFKSTNASHGMGLPFKKEEKEKKRENSNCTLANSCDDFEMILAPVPTDWNYKGYKWALFALILHLQKGPHHALVHLSMVSDAGEVIELSTLPLFLSCTLPFMVSSFLVDFDI